MVVSFFNAYSGLLDLSTDILDNIQFADVVIK